MIAAPPWSNLGVVLVDIEGGTADDGTKSINIAPDTLASCGAGDGSGTCTTSDRYSFGGKGGEYFPYPPNTPCVVVGEETAGVGAAPIGHDFGQVTRNSRDVAAGLEGEGVDLGVLANSSNSTPT